MPLTKKDVKVGSVYATKIGGRLTKVKITEEVERRGYGPNSRTMTHWRAKNLGTGREVEIKSATKLLRELSEPEAKLFDRSLTSPPNRVSALKAPERPATAPEAIEGVPTSLTAPERSLEAPRASKTVSTDTAPEIPRLKLSEYLGKPEVPEVTEVTDKLIPMGKKEPTEEQKAILKGVQQGHKVLVVTAGAGTGKTTTLRMIGDTLSGNGQYTAFNSSLVGESKSKFEGTKVACNTTHSLAFRAIGKVFAHRLGGQRVKSYVVAQMLGLKDFEYAITVAGKEEKRRLAAPFLAGQVMGAVKRFCQSDDRELSANHFRYIDGIDLPTEEGGRTYSVNQKVRDYLLPFARKAWDDLSRKDGQLPFTHDHYVKIWQLNKPVIAADYILLDEAQDTAPVMLDIIRQQSIPVIIVGDSAQQIYEWRGAVDALAAFPEAPRLMLSQSFRFGPAIAEVANQVLATLEEPTELRLKGLPSIESKITAIENPTAILTRTNALAVSSLLAAISEGKRPHLIGGGSDVISFVEGAKSLKSGQATSHPELACFADWTEVVEYSKLDEGEDLKLMVKLIDSFGCDVILDALRGMPEEKDANLVICTAHKSKGREWDRVRLGNDFPTESKSTDSDRKLLYVAVTRAKLELDVTACPFFTGQDSLDISTIAAKYREGRAEGVETPVALPAAPSVPPTAPEGFTWAKGQSGDWLARGPKGKSGETVEIVRKDGSKSKRRLGAVVWENGSVALYKV